MCLRRLLVLLLRQRLSTSIPPVGLKVGGIFGRLGFVSRRLGEVHEGRGQIMAPLEDVPLAGFLCPLSGMKRNCVSELKRQLHEYTPW
jgi:hypothetical protein